MDYSKQCWSCGEKTMEPRDTHYQCTSCGATWNEQPTLGEFIDIARDYKGTGGGASYHPVRRTASAAKAHIRRIKK